MLVRVLHYSLRCDARTRAFADQWPERSELSVAIQMLKQITSRKMKLHNMPRFWQVRYYDFPVWSERKRIEKLRYIHRNPVKRGLVSRPEDWRWSSFAHYATGAEGVVEIESQWTARRREMLGVSLTARNTHPVVKNATRACPERSRRGGATTAGQGNPTVSMFRSKRLRCPNTSHKYPHPDSVVARCIMRSEVISLLVPFFAFSWDRGFHPSTTSHVYRHR